jgi:hypothetical protein
VSIRSWSSEPNISLKLKGYGSIWSVRITLDLTAPVIICLNRNQPIRHRHVVTPDLKHNSNRILNQISIEILKIHIFWSVTQKITNNMSLESLRHIESISAIIFHRFSIQFENIFKLNQTLLLAYLFHIFCFKCPKITNL